MHNAEQLVKSISKQSWTTRNSFIKGHKFISAHKIVNSLKTPVDFHKIAEHCSQNPNHEHFGKEPDVIMQLWQSKGKSGAKRGNYLDIYITDLLKHDGDSTRVSIHSDADEKTIKKFKSFTKFYKETLQPVTSYIGSEIWLTSKLGIACRLDALFEFHSTVTQQDHLLIFDWKNHEKISAYNRYRNMQGPLQHLDESEVNTMTLQLYVYQYILEEYGYDVGGVRICQLLEDTTIVRKPGFAYSKSLMEEIIEYAVKQQTSNQ